MKKKETWPVPKDRLGSQVTNYVTSVSYKNYGKMRCVKSISEYECQNFPKGHSTPVKLLQRVNLRDNTTQFNMNLPGMKIEGNSSMLITSQSEDHQFKIMPAKLMRRIEPTSILNSGRCSNYEKSVDNLKPDNLLDKVIEYVKHRPDLHFIAFRRILLCSLDLISILVFLWPIFVIDSLLENFAILWEFGKNCKLQLPFEQVLCIRNVDILKQVTKEHQKHIFVALEKYLSFTLERKIMRSSKRFRQVLKLLLFEGHDEELISNVIIHVKESLEKCPFPNIKILTAIESLLF